jgi:hypothetical protein
MGKRPSISTQYLKHESPMLRRFFSPILGWNSEVCSCTGLNCWYYLFGQSVCPSTVMLVRNDVRILAHNSPVLSDRLSPSCGSRFLYLRIHCWCLVWGEDERGRRVGRRASLDQYSTHIASAGGGWREQHLKLREKDGALGRTTEKQAEAISPLCFTFTHLSLFLLKVCFFPCARCRLKGAVLSKILRA